jgi:hypothetical protein
MRRCSHCEGPVEASYRFCPACAAPQRRKLVEFFRRHPGVTGGPGEALRVSRYFETEDSPAQFRLSIWSGDRADAAISLDDAEAARLSRFLAPPGGQRRRLLDELRASLRV